MLFFRSSSFRENVFQSIINLNILLCPYAFLNQLDKLSGEPWQVQYRQSQPTSVVCYITPLSHNVVPGHRRNAYNYLLLGFRSVISLRPAALCRDSCQVASAGANPALSVQDV